MIAVFCFRDNIVGYKDELKPEDYAKLFSKDRLIRTEISTLIGLLVRAPIDLTIPPPEKVQELIDRTEALLHELHQSMMQPFAEDFKQALEARKQASEVGATGEVNPFNSATAMREPIFYGGESAYVSQYRDLAAKKYAGDEDWLKREKGFSIEEAQQVVSGLGDFLNTKLAATLHGLKNIPLSQWSLLDGFTFSAAEVAERIGISGELTTKILNAFSFANDGNPSFTALQEYNATNAFPIIGLGEGRYALFQYYSLAEALYDTPFYWMAADRTYAPIAMANRGKFTEKFSAECFEQIFGKDKVFNNVDIWDSPARKRKLGEIDTLVLFADRAIVGQAKSKKLTLAARKGNDLQLKSDFQAAVQDAYDQAISCAQQLIAGTAMFTDSGGAQIPIPKNLRLVHPICIVAEHYPALSFQVRNFLRSSSTENIAATLVCDVFLIDVVTEFLRTPLRLLSYLELRAMAGDNVMFSHEIVALGYHLKRNLWLGEYDFMMLEDDLSTDIDIAMAVRRDGLGGQRTPPGILTKLEGTSFAQIIAEIEKRSEPGPVALGLELLKLGEDTAREFSAGVDKITADTAKDGRQHDVTMGVGAGATGFTLHCNEFPDDIAASKLEHHCRIRKYSQKAKTWYGLCVRAGDAALRFAMGLDFPWKFDGNMEKLVKEMPKGLSPVELKQVLSGRSPSRGKVGRNAPCPCGSGRKYKNCCLRKN